MHTAPAVVAIPDYLTGTWKADSVHSEIAFSVRHLMVSKARGRFTSYDVTIVTSENPLASTVAATIDLASINTGFEPRDSHLRSADYFDVEVNGFRPDPFGGQRAGFSATAQINRRDFGVDLNMPIDGGGLVIGDKVSISIEIEAVLQS